MISVNIGGISREVLVHSGTASNLIIKDTVQELKHQELKIKLQPCTKSLYAYGGREVNDEGRFQAEVSVSKANKDCGGDFIVVKTERCLLGYSTATELGILHMDPAGTPGTSTGDRNTVLLMVKLRLQKYNLRGIMYSIGCSLTAGVH